MTTTEGNPTGWTPEWVLEAEHLASQRRDAYIDAETAVYPKLLEVMECESVHDRTVLAVELAAVTLKLVSATVNLADAERALDRCTQ